MDENEICKKCAESDLQCSNTFCSIFLLGQRNIHHIICMIFIMCGIQLFLRFPCHIIHTIFPAYLFFHTHKKYLFSGTKPCTIFDDLEIIINLGFLSILFSNENLPTFYSNVASIIVFIGECKSYLLFFCEGRKFMQMYQMIFIHHKSFVSVIYTVFLI